MEQVEEKVILMPTQIKNVWVLEPSPVQLYAGTYMVPLWKILLHFGFFSSKREIKKNPAFVKIVPAKGSSNIDVFITNNVTATFEFWPGDDIWIEFRGKTLTEEVLQLLSQ